MMRLLTLFLFCLPAFGQFGASADRAYTTLASGIAATDTTITLTDGTAFPNSAYYVVVCPTTECRIGETAANGETISVTGKASTHVLNIASTGRQVDADGVGVSTGDAGNPTHATGEAVVLTIVAAQWNELRLAALTSPVAIADGGTGQTTQTAAMDALSPTTTKGDILVDNGTSVIRVPVGTNDQVLTADSAQASGLKWAAAGGATPACDFDWTPAMGGYNVDSGATAISGMWGAQAYDDPTQLQWAQNFYVAFDLANEAILFHIPVPSCYSAQTMDLVLYFVRYSVGSVDVDFIVDTAFVGDDEVADNPTYNATQAFTVLDADVSAAGDLNIVTISGLTMTGATAGDLAYIRIEADVVTSGTALLKGFQIREQ